MHCFRSRCWSRSRFPDIAAAGSDSPAFDDAAGMLPRLEADARRRCKVPTRRCYSAVTREQLRLTSVFRCWQFAVPRRPAGRAGSDVRERRAVDAPTVAEGEGRSSPRVAAATSAAVVAEARRRRHFRWMSASEEIDDGNKHRMQRTQYDEMQHNVTWRNAIIQRDATSYNIIQCC